MNAFLIDGKWITDKNVQLAVALIMNFPTELPLVSGIFLYLVKTNCLVLLNEPLQYQEVFNVCSKLKSGVSGVLIDYEHIRF